MKLEIKLLDKEGFFGGACNDATKMPFTKESNYSIDFRLFHSDNQASAVLISSLGRAIYSKEPMAIKFQDGLLTVEGEDIYFDESSKNFKEAYLKIKDKFYHGDHKTPDLTMFEKPQYNTWVTMEWDCTEKKILDYSKEILKHHYEPGVLMIDDCWCEDYGVWEFDHEKFTNPKKMVDTLHKQGFTVMLWVCPFISPDSKVFRELENKDVLFKDVNGKTAISHWWNGYSAVLDFTKPSAVSWFTDQLKNLQKKYGIDGFKLDACDPEFYEDNFVMNGINKSYQAINYCKIGEQFPFNELRVAFNNHLTGVAHRLRDKNHSWNNDGINTLIPNGIVEGIDGYPYFCPDMIGGGMILDFDRPDFVFEEDLFVRYAEASTLFPMMQFSLLPWRVLSKNNQKIVKNMVDIHTHYAPLIKNLALKSAKDGEPIVTSLLYQFGDINYQYIKDQFMLGSELMVAPMIQKGKKRKVIIPPGTWVDELKNEYKEGTYIINVPLNRLPIFTKKGE